MGAEAWFDALEDIRLDLLNIYGRRYVIEHCVSAIRRKNEAKDELFKIYITDMLKGIAETVIYSTYDQKVELPRYADTIKEIKEPPKKKKPQSADEIIFNIRKRITELQG